MFYSKLTNGFYTKEIHADNMPDDVVEITPDEHAELLNAQSIGKIIQYDAKSKKPVAIDPPALTSGQLAMNKIRDLEAAITPRRLREAALGIDDGWLKKQNDLIVAERDEV